MFAKVFVSGVVQVHCVVRARKEVQSSSNLEAKNRKSVLVGIGILDCLTQRLVTGLEWQHFYFGFWV